MNTKKGNTDSINRLGGYLKSLRESLGYTQSYVASELNILQQTYSHYETGRIIPPTKTLQALSKIYAVPAEDLLGLTEPPDQDYVVSAHTPCRDAGSMNDMNDYISYISQPINESRLRFLSESEKRLLYYYAKLDIRDKGDLLRFLAMRTE